MTTMIASAPKVTYLKEYVPSAFLIESVHLWFDLHEDQACVRSELAIRSNLVGGQQEALFLNGEDMELQSISLNGMALTEDKFSVSEKGLTIFDVPDNFTLTTQVVIRPQDNTLLMGLYKSRGNFCTQCEAEGFRRITYFIDRPDIMSRFKVTISADKTKYPMLLSNGNCLDSQDLDDGRHQVVWEDPSLKPCYLFALVAGSFDLIEDEFSTSSGRNVSLRFYLERGFREQGHYAMGALKRAMRWDEEVYGREYDLDIYMVVAVSDFTMGAMENKGLNIFNTKYVLAQPETATDHDFAAIEDVIGHEYFHNWSGNRVTCRDWFQLTLKEGLTVFRDHSFSTDMTSPSLMRIAQVKGMRERQFPEDAGPMAHPIRAASYIEINNFYTTTVYEKGSEVIGMVQTLLGKEMFRRGMDLYFSRHDGQAVTTEEFIQAMMDASEKDLTQFKRWYDQAGTPVLDIQHNYDAGERRWTLTVKQSCPATPGQETKLPFHLPLAMGALSDKGKTLSLQLEGDSASKETLVLEITEPEHTFVFDNMTTQPIPSLLRNFSAPVKVNCEYSNEELSILMQHDTDAVARWDAGQALMVRALMQAATQHQHNETTVMEPSLIDAIERILKQPGDDLIVLVHLLTLPTVAYLMQIDSTMDVLAWDASHSFVKSTIADMFESHFSDHYQKLHTETPYEYSMENFARRSFKNMCLSYLVATEQERYAEMALQQFEQADNMTDSWGALIALNQHDSALRNKALDAFYQRWQDEPLVVNKWFSLHAQANFPDSLERVMQLTKHEAFSLSNPNNVYALICGFAANTVGFHRSVDGGGYAFIVDQALALDKINSLVAARVINPLTRWRQLEPARAALMQQQLHRMAATEGLSSDLYEVVSKSL